MDKDIRRYYKRRQNGGRGVLARTADSVMLHAVFAAGCYLWFRQNVKNEMLMILLTAATILLFFVALRIWRDIRFDRYVRREEEHLKDDVLRERLLMLPAVDFHGLCKRAAEHIPGFEEAYLVTFQRMAPLTEDDILAAFHAAQAEGYSQMAIFSLSEPSEAAAALLKRIPARTECLPPAMLSQMAQQMDGFTVSDADVARHIRSALAVRKERRARAQAEPFAAGRAGKYLLCAGVLTLASFITGYALYYRLLAGLCVLLSATGFLLNRPAARTKPEQSSAA